MSKSCIGYSVIRKYRCSNSSAKGVGMKLYLAFLVIIKPSNCALILKLHPAGFYPVQNGEYDYPAQAGKSVEPNIA